MKINHLHVLSFVLLSLIHFAASFILESFAIGGAATAVISYAFRCKFYECCNDYYVPQNTTELKNQMQKLLYGQHIVQDIVYSAIHSHVTKENPRKPLVLSFHGGPGVGKNYVADMIAKSMFQLGVKSKHYHFFSGLADFPSNETKDVLEYKMHIKRTIEQALNDCEKSIFVFDEVDKIAPKVLDILVPFIDYTSWSKVENKKALFIFISNTGSGEIVQKMIELWEKGTKREEIGIEDFERMIELGAFNEEGGLQKSSAIESKVIDFHVPFLLLETKHVIECIKDVFRSCNVTDPSQALIDKARRHITYGPKPHNVYATDGCKKFEYKVSSLLNRIEYDN